jgi:hypothetical protein
MFSRTKHARSVGVAASAFALAALAASLVGAGPARAATTMPYQATFVEPYGGPVQSPFSCPPGTSCGSANVSGLGHVQYQLIIFNDCGLGCHLRTLTFADGSTLVIREVQLGSFSPPGNSGAHGYIGFGLSGNPQFLEITQTILGGAGRLAGASGSGTGMVKVAGGVAIIKASGSITLP